MIEIFILYRLCSSLGNKIRAKGRNALGLQFLLVFLWFAGEFIGGIFGYLIGAIATGDEDAGTLFAIVGAICGVVAASVTVFQIAGAMQSAYVVDDYGKDDSYGPGWRERDREQLRRYDKDRERDGITDRPDNLPRRQLDDRVQE